ncbi:MAG TPA: alpha/beta hydrolase, partial [Spirochaetia bacterium]|nr:alpha/beta hydrolase [Spirochaetia bacterium]
MKPTGPHAGQPVLTSGSELKSAAAAMIMVHGRGASAEDILELASMLDAPGLAFLAPQAAGHTWYPNRFLAPISSNEPGISSALSVLADIEGRVLNAGIPAGRVFFLGFSQGACLALEYAARNARRFGGIIGLSGSLIGPAEAPRSYAGSLGGVPVFMGCSDIDPHIPKDRFLASAEVLKSLGAEVDARIYPGMGHVINQDEVTAVTRMLS